MQRQTVTKKRSQRDKEVRNKDPQPSETHHALSVQFQRNKERSVQFMQQTMRTERLILLTKESKWMKNKISGVDLVSTIKEKTRIKTNQNQKG